MLVISMFLTYGIYFVLLEVPLTVLVLRLSVFFESFLVFVYP